MDLRTSVLLAGMMTKPEIIPPEPYEKVDFIQSGENQYINTNITPSSDLEYFKITFNLQNPISTSGFGGVFGAEVSGVRSGGIRILSFAVTDGGQGVIYGNEFNPHLQQNKKITLELKNKIYTTSEGDREEFTDFVQYSTNRKILLFAIQGTSVSYKSKMKLYEFKMGMNENNLVIDLIPVLNKQTGEYGMYDTISKQFFGNLGTGAFSGGND